MGLTIRAGYRISYDCAAPVAILLMLNVRPEREVDLVTPETLTCDPALPVRRYTDGFGNTVARVMAPAGRTTFSCDFLIRDTGEPDRAAPDAVQHRVEDLPDEVLVYLLASRYCETEHLVDLAWSVAGSAAPGWARVQAVVDHVHAHIRFGYPNARATRTALEAHEERMGVCRDFAHLAVTLCRCLNIPARYCTGYLGDIGVEPVDAAMDFSAWFEVYLGGDWHTFDARHNRPRLGRILVAYGRDATDVAIATTFGAATLTEFTVITKAVVTEAAVEPA